MSKLISTLNLFIQELPHIPKYSTCTLPMEITNRDTPKLYAWCVHCKYCAFSVNSKSVVAGALDESIDKIT